MTARLCAFVIWAAVAASAVFWSLRLWVRAPTAPAGASSVEATSAARGDLTRLFGAAPLQPVALAPPPPAESSRYRLTGVMAPRPSGSWGVALVAVDGKPPRAYKVGARVEGEVLLRSVSLRSATFGAAGSPASFTLDMPPLVPPSTGTLPALSFTPPASQLQALPQTMVDPSQNVGEPEVTLGTAPIGAPPTQPAQNLPPSLRRNFGNAANQR